MASQPPLLLEDETPTLVQPEVSVPIPKMEQPHHSIQKEQAHPIYDVAAPPIALEDNLHHQSNQPPLIPQPQAILSSEPAQTSTDQTTVIDLFSKDPIQSTASASAPVSAESSGIASSSHQTPDGDKPEVLEGNHASKEGSSSPLSAESNTSNVTDTAYQFYHAQQSGQETADTYPEPQGEEPTEPDHQMTDQPERSDAQNRDDVVLPDDGYYPTSLHVDSEMSDSDSAIGSDIQSSTMSLRSSLYETIMENGRSYHKYKEGQYLLPNDDIEQDRLNLQHHLWNITLDGRLHIAPVDNPIRVLDIGTGTGSWALDYAERNPAATVIGTDLSPIQPEYVPPNCQFEIDDAEDDWTYTSKFDFIHGRMLFTCFQDPAAVFRRAYDALAPGGYFEVQDIVMDLRSIDGTADGTAIQDWNRKIISGAAKIGRDWACTLKYAQFMRDAGFEGVTERHAKWPSNAWPKGKTQKLMGMWSMSNFLEGLPSISMAIMTRAHGMTRDEVEVGMVQVRHDIKDKSIHGYVPVLVVYGRKPMGLENIAT